MSLKLTQDVVFCTKDRFDALKVALDSILLAPNAESLNIIIVDSTEDQTELKNLCENYRKRDIFRSISITFSPPGLPRARNEALKLVKSDIVTFFDDDVFVYENYFQEIDDIFFNNVDVVGVGPRILGQYSLVLSNTSPKSYLARRSLTKNFGRVTKYGHSYWFPDIQIDELLDAEWLPGCCMSYRYTALNGLTFNTNLEKGPGKNYALGEDVDFSLKVRSKGRIVQAGNSLVDHRQAPSKRDDRPLMARAQGMWAGYLAREHSSYVSIWKTLSVMVFQTFLLAARSLLGRDQAWHNLKFSIIKIGYFVREIVFPRLKD